MKRISKKCIFYNIKSSERRVLSLSKNPILVYYQNKYPSSTTIELHFYRLKSDTEIVFIAIASKLDLKSNFSGIISLHLMQYTKIFRMWSAFTILYVAVIANQEHIRYP